MRNNTQIIELKPLQPDGFEPFCKWLNDEEVIKYSLSKFKKLNTRQEIKEWYSGLFNETNVFQLGIYFKANQQLIGHAGISKLSKTNHSGEYFIFIGEKDFWEKGIATEATKKFIEIGFTKLNLNRIMLTVSEFNVGGIRAYQNAGFKEEGRLRQACFRDKKYHDKIVMSILKQEWEKQLNP
jgi:RimJ/RimL family protein N-acetyltransferase